jgi:Flp pilus assembly protein TadG
MKRHLSWLRRDKNGAVAPTVALSLVALIAAGGLAFDYARMATLDTELQNAADQAALAGATQLDGQPRAMERAQAAALALIENDTRFSNDGDGSAVDIDPAEFVFYETKADAEADTNPIAATEVTRFAEAHFVRVKVIAREAVYALTPIVSAFRSDNINAEATAGLGSAICKVPPLMICNPTPGTTFDASAWRGRGIRSVANQGNQWSAGGFGYLSVGGIDTPSTQEAMAFENPTFSCQNIDTGQVDTGNPTPAITAVNTRFDIYDYGGGTLSPCLSGACPAALNVTKDVVRAPGVSGTSGNACKIHNSQGWHLPDSARRFSPMTAPGAYDPNVALDSDGIIDAMGLPRDNCHYDSYGVVCPGTDARLGNGEWARKDYFDKYHAGHAPSGWETMTRYEVYRWEIDNDHIPGEAGHPAPAAANGDLQHGEAVCNATVPDPSRDRRVFVVAVVENCGALHGTSTPAQIGSWIEIFFVEPGMNGRGNGSTQGEIYMEVIGNASVGATGQVLRRDTPYLVK